MEGEHAPISGELILEGDGYDSGPVIHEYPCWWTDCAAKILILGLSLLLILWPLLAER